MTNGELIEMLIRHAKEFMADRPTVFERNKHMFKGLKEVPSYEDSAAILTGFLNHVASKHGMDLGMYLEDF